MPSWQQKRSSGPPGGGFQGRGSFQGNRGQNHGQASGYQGRQGGNYNQQHSGGYNNNQQQQSNDYHQQQQPYHENRGGGSRVQGGWSQKGYQGNNYDQQSRGYSGRGSYRGARR